MRTAIVNSSALVKDLRAETYCAATPEDIQKAKVAGWNCGARGTKHFTSTSFWAFRHGKPEIKKAFLDAYAAGRAARKEYLE